MAERVAGVVLAAGLSSRMGSNKLFVELGGTTLLRRAAQTAISAALEPVLVVLGNEHERAQRELSGLPCTPVFNRDYARGMHTSLRIGASALPADAAAVVVMLADMPFVTSTMLQALVAKWRVKRSAVAISLYGDVLAPPTLYAAELFSALRAVKAEGDGKRLVLAHRDAAAELRWPADALSDVDDPADVELARTRLRGG